MCWDQVGDNLSAFFYNLQRAFDGLAQQGARVPERGRRLERRDALDFRSRLPLVHGRPVTENVGE
jgi:hypothetical protein